MEVGHFQAKIHRPFLDRVVPTLASGISRRRLVAKVGTFENKKVHKHLHLWPLGPRRRRLAVRSGTSKGSTISQYGWSTFGALATEAQQKVEHTSAYNVYFRKKFRTKWAGFASTVKVRNARVHGTKRTGLYTYQHYAWMSNTKLMIMEKAKVHDQKHLHEIIKPWGPFVIRAFRTLKHKQRFRIHCWSAYRYKGRYLLHGGYKALLWFHWQQFKRTYYRRHIFLCKQSRQYDNYNPVIQGRNSHDAKRGSNIIYCNLIISTIIHYNQVLFWNPHSIIINHIIILKAPADN